MMKKIFAMLLLLVLCVGLAVTASAAPDTGTTGKCTWSFDDSTGVLTISGSGAMADYSGSNDQPWASYKDSIQTIVINEG
ncbi:MAG: leucine-rich repeat domain-containing protein, partial [Clostridia bacterium]|nr:leucine-rich repeat domain-containing protein [Clostridia bacterium]